MIAQPPRKETLSNYLELYRIHCSAWRIAPLRPGSLMELALPRVPTLATSQDQDTWWKNQPNANPALIVPEGLVVVDVDGELRQDPLFDGYEGPEIRRPGGWYLFFRVGREIRNDQVKPGLRVWGRRSVVPLPPTEGHTWLTAPWEAEIPEAPAWLHDFCEERQQTRRLTEEDLEEARKRASQATEAAKDDPGAPFTPEVLSAFAILREYDPATYETLRAELKKAKVRVGELDKRVKTSMTLAQENDDRKESQAQILIQIAQSTELFHSPAAECFAAMAVDGHKECWPIRSKAFKKWLCREYFRETEGKAPNNEALQNALNVIEAQATFDGPEVQVYTRIAEADGKIYLDLCNDKWEAVEISESGWRVLDESPVRFRRAEGMAPLPRPVEGGSLEDLRRFVNAPDDRTWILLVSWLLGCFHPRGPYPVLVLQGEHGSGKTTTLRVLRDLVDPNFSATRTIPREERDLAIAAKNAWVVAFDNLSGLPTWLSDALCRLSTGGGLSTRKLYTDDEEALFYAKRPVVVNGIDEIVSRNDLLDRALIVSLSSIPEHERKREDAFWREFEKARPKLLGALCDAIQVGLANKNIVTLNRLPRMADFAAWVVAAEAALPWENGDFMAAYCEMREDAIAQSLEFNVVAKTLLQFMEEEDRGNWSGTASELLEELETRVTEKTLKSRKWPKAPNVLSNRLRQVAPFLRTRGIHISFRSDGRGSDRKRIISIDRVCETSSPSSPSFPCDESTSTTANFAGTVAGTISDVGSIPHQESFPFDRPPSRDGNGPDGGNDEIHTLSVSDDEPF